MGRSASSMYEEVGRRSEIEGASPHKLIELLLLNAVKNINSASHAIELGEIETRGKAIAKAGEIVAYLRESLDYENGGEISANLHSLYWYVEGELVKAHINEDREILAHLASILGDLLDTWKQIKDEI